jgi:hypothetical protein
VDGVVPPEHGSMEAWSMAALSSSLAEHFNLPDPTAETQVPQTSGGLLAAVDHRLNVVVFLQVGDMGLVIAAPIQ